MAPEAGMLVAPEAGMLVAPSPRPYVSDAKCLKAGMLTVPLPLPAIPDSRGPQLSHPFLRWPAGPARQLILDKVAEDKSRILVWGMVTDQAGGQPYLRCATSLPSTSQVGEVAVRGADQWKGADDVSGQPYPQSTLLSGLYEHWEVPPWYGTCLLRKG